MDLIKKSAKTASAKLQFCRLAFGAAGSAGAQIDTGDAEKVARGLIEDERFKVAWNLPRVLLAKSRVKLLLNMLLLAAQAIPRGGQVVVDPVGEGDATGFRITVTGTNAKVPQAIPGLLSATPGEHAIDAHAMDTAYVLDNVSLSTWTPGWSSKCWRRFGAPSRKPHPDCGSGSRRC